MLESKSNFSVCMQISHHILHLRWQDLLAGLMWTEQVNRVPRELPRTPLPSALSSLSTLPESPRSILRSSTRMSSTNQVVEWKLYILVQLDMKRNFLSNQDKSSLTVRVQVFWNDHCFIVVYESKEEGWLVGTLNGKTGLIPANYVEPLPGPQ